MFGDDYILQIAQESQNGVIVGLDNYLRVNLELSDDDDFEDIDNEDAFLDNLRTAVMMAVLGWPSGDLLPKGFAETHAELIAAKAKNLSKDEKLCQVLSGAIYNMGYGQYVKGGGGRVLNRYLGFMRLQRRASIGSDIDAFVSAQSRLDRTDPMILRSYHSLKRFGIWRSRPDNPNEKDYYQAIYNFAKSFPKL